MHVLRRNLTLLIAVSAGSLSTVSLSADLDWTEQAISPEMIFSTSPVTCKVFRIQEVADYQDGRVLTVPFPDGSMHQFQVVESSLMHPELAAAFPEIRTWEGWEIGQPACALRMDRTPKGYHLQILTPDDTIYIDPCLPGDPTMHVVHYRSDARAKKAWACNVPVHNLRARLQRIRANFSHGDVKRIYRLAIAATAEYTQFHGGTVSNGMAAIVTTINRVSGIYERELSIGFQLVANNHLLVYTNSVTDPYSNNNGTALASENQSNIDSVVGDANYDIGHVFGTGGGGLADTGLCVSGFKARAQTGSSSPVGDAFDVDFVAHEMAHQLNANHIFNGSISLCGSNRHAPTAYAPGSGSTILSYVGLCGSDNLQSNSDDYFHSASLEEIIHYLATVPACAVTNATGNQIPIVDAGLDVVIPASTPFVLTASGSDPDGQAVYYSWEQMDLGPPAPLSAADDGSIPLFRSWSPSLDPSRTFPRLAELLNNTTPKGEKLPTTSRSLNFRVSARDWSPGGGAVNTDEMIVTVDATAGPFQVTQPNSAVTWSNQQTVTWDVANTDGGLVSEATVDILLSLDGGLTFPQVLATGTANDGSERVQLPSTDSSTARIKVAAANGIFFDLSNSEFTLLSFEVLSVQPLGAQVFTGPAGGPFSPDCFTFSVSNVTSDAFDWQVGVNPMVVDVQPSSGTLAGSQGLSIQVCTNAAAAALGTGTHTAFLTFTNLTNGETVQRQLTIDAAAPGGTIAMESSLLTVGEAVGNASVNVIRSGYSNRAVNVTYQTVPNSATAGGYVAVTGSVNWAVGETGVKTLSLGIVDDAVVEGSESFHVDLANPGNGAELGVPNRTTIAITDNDAPGANDRCADAVVVNSMPYSATQSTIGFTSTGDPLPLCSGEPARAAWYRYTPPTVGRLWLSTSGSSFDTVLVLYQGTCTSLTEWVCGDDVGASQNATVASVVYPGQTYYIMAGGHQEAAGDLAISMSFDPETNTCINLVQDGDFEEGNPYPYWPVNSSDNFNLVICDGSCGPTGATAGPRSGANWAWYSAKNGSVETGNVGQVVFIPDGNAMLSFYLWMGFVAAPFNDVFSVLIDETPVFTIAEPSTADPGYQAYTIDVSAFADGQPHALVFRLVGDGGGNGNYSLDDISLEVCIPDLDADGMPNAWESGFGLNPTNASDASVDSDLDGLTNQEEYIANTDPLDPDDFLKLLLDEVRASVADVSFGTATGRLYALDYRDAWSTGTWKNLRTNVPGTGNSMTLQDTNSAGYRLYRLGVGLSP